MSNPFVIVESKGHGKAVKGRKKTSSWQVRDYCFSDPKAYALLKQITFKRGSIAAKNAAYAKAQAFVKAEQARATAPLKAPL